MPQTSSTIPMLFLAAVAMLLASGVLYHLLAKDSDQLEPAAERVALAQLLGEQGFQR